jgi:hypothetical protein
MNQSHIKKTMNHWKKKVEISNMHTFVGFFFFLNKQNIRWKIGKRYSHYTQLPTIVYRLSIVIEKKNK